MKDKISKFINLQGKYLTSLLFVLLFGVGQMWGVTYTYDFDAATDFTTQTTTKDKNNVTLAQTSYTLNATETGAPSKTFDVVICSVDKNKERSVSYESGKGLKFDRCGALAFSLSEPSIVKILVTSKACVFGKDPAYGTTYTASNYQSFGSNPTTELTAGSEITINCDAGNYKICCPEATGGAYRVRSIKITPAAKVTFDGNGATSGSMEAVYFEKGVATNLPANAFEKSGNDFGGWKDASENTYTDEQSVTLSANLALTAQWVEPLPRYAVKYNKGANGTGTIADGEKIDGTPFTLSSDMFTRESYLQVGWTETDGNARDYMLGGKYTTDAAITLYPAWAQKVTDTYNYSDAKTIAQLESAGWTFNSKSFDSDPTDTEAYANLVSAMNTAGLGAPKTNGMEDNAIAFAKNASAYAMYDLGNATTVSALNVTLYGGSSNAFDQKIEYVAADGSTVLKSYTNSLSAGNWASNSISKTDVIPNVRYIKVYGASKWVVMSAFSVTYGDLSTKYAVNFAKGHADATGTMAAVEYKEGATVTAPACGFERDGYTFSKWSVNGVTGTTEVLKDGTFAMPANTVTLTAQWIETSVTYDITYSSAHGTAPDAANAAMVELAELTESGWQHVGWTADVDVTVDAETVTAGTLIANGKTAILASNVTFTAVWNQIYTVTYNANGGTCATSEATWKAGDDALVLPAATKDNFDFVGWYDAATGGNKIASPYTPSASIELFAHFMPKLVRAIYSNTFDAFIKNQKVNVYYLEGESAPTLTSIKVLGVETPVFEEVDGNIKVTVAEVDYIFPVTKTAVSPYTGTGSKETFDGTETYIKTGNAFSTDSGKEGWKFSKTDSDWSREADGRTRIYFFLGAFESLTFENGGTARNIKVYRNGVELATPTSSGSATIAGINVPAMYAVVSNQTGGDGAFKSVTFTPWVPTTGVALKEGETAISEKEIYAGENFTLTAEVTPANASNKTITWTSDDETIATVVNGVVTGESVGTATITASTVDGVNATCVVTVTEAPSPCETPVITADPANVAYCAGSEPTLTVAANVPSDGGTLHYAWFKEAGETDEAVGTDAASYTVEAAGTYYVIVTNKKEGKLDASVTSENAGVTLNTPASITAQPTDLKKQTEGANIMLSVVAANATGYQWYSCDNKDKENPVVIAGANAANYEFEAAAGFYYCEVTGLCGNVESNVAQVTVKRSAGCQYITATSGLNVTLADGLKMYAAESDGKQSTSGTSFATASSNVKGLDAGAVGSINKQYILVQFPVDVEEFTIYGYNSSNRYFNNLRVNDHIGTTSADKFTSDMELSNQVVTKTNAKDGNEISMTAELNVPIAKENYVWIKFNSALEIYRICYTAALVEPKLPTLGNQELCAGAAYQEFDATITNEAACEGTVSYKWYDVNDTETPVATTATFTPSTEGTYYVVVTHSAAGHITRTVQSDNLTVAHFDALTLVSNSGDVFQHMGTAATLSVVATGKNVAYVWYTCSNAAGDDAVAIDPAETEAELTIASILEGVHYYKVVISHDCDATTLSHVFKVEGWDQLEQVDVTASTVWDMNNVSASHIELTGDDKNARLLLANIDGVNNTTFNAQALYFEGQHIGRTGADIKHLAGRYVQFNVTVPGAVFVTFESNGNNARTISINGKKCSRTTAGTDADDYITYALAVEPGSVEIIGYEGESENQYVRISKIEFKAEYSYHRENLNPSFLGTLCWTNNAILGGATLYEFAGKDEYNKLVFDEVAENRLEAGKPYIFMPENGNTEIKLYNTDDAEPLTTNQAHVNHMYGTIVATDLYPTTDVNMYYFSSNHIWAVKDFTVEKITVPAYYCYVDYPAVLAGEPAAAAAPGRRRVTMGVQGEQVVTGVENLNASEQPVKLLINGQIFILRGEKMFDATGRLVK